MNQVNILEANSIIRTSVLPKILGPEWLQVRWQKHDGVIMYFACDVKEVLGLSNVTTATSGVTAGNRVERSERVKAYPYDPNIPCKVILLTLIGVYQLILNNNSAMSKKYRNYIACNILPHKKNLVLYDAV
jgi:prophage antirepressor-like protein